MSQYIDDSILVPGDVVTNFRLTLLVDCNVDTHAIVLNHLAKNNTRIPIHTTSTTQRCRLCLPGWHIAQTTFSSLLISADPVACTVFLHNAEQVHEISVALHRWTSIHDLALSPSQAMNALFPPLFDALFQMRHRTNVTFLHYPTRIQLSSSILAVRNTDWKIDLVTFDTPVFAKTFTLIDIGFDLNCWVMKFSRSMNAKFSNSPKYHFKDFQFERKRACQMSCFRCTALQHKAIGGMI